MTTGLGSPVDDPALLASVIAWVGRGDFEAWQAAVAHAGHCAHPIRLRGRITHVDKATGVWRSVFATAGLPDGVLLVGCGNRRATACPECARIYAGDARRLVTAGLVGDSEHLPAEANPAGHPAVFLTATAPSFGAVHSRRLQDHTVQVCHPRRDACCRHGRPLGCWTRHREDDPALGEPLCPDCYHYDELILWNAAVPELWRRTTIYLKRALARRMGLSARQLAALVRPTYVKVGELQARGALHLYAVLRLDAATLDPDTLAPPPARFTAELLATALQDALAAVRAPVPDPHDPAGRRSARWGEQVRADPIRLGPDVEVTPGRVAGYLAKYTTKGADALGVLDRRLRSLDQLATLDLRPHQRRLVATAWTLGGRPHLAHLRLRAWAHCFGFGGHWLTKSRRYSTTFGVLRRARREHRRRQGWADATPLDAFGRPEADQLVHVVGTWSYAGAGYPTAGDRWLALSAAARAREHRQAAREAHYTTPLTCCDRERERRGQAVDGGRGGRGVGHLAAVRAPADRRAADRVHSAR